MTFLGRYNNMGELGKGGFGAVFKVIDDKSENREQYALKVIFLDKIKTSPVLMKYLRGQIKCMQTMDSPFLIKLHSVQQDNHYLYLLTQYCQGGDLSGYVGKKLKQGVYTIDQATEVLADVVRGLQYLHGRDYIHRDIKLQNVLVKKQNGKNVYKLADFGFSKPKTQIKGTNLGTQPYKAPQIFLKQKYDYKVDMWAFGVLFFVMLNIQFPFNIINDTLEAGKGKNLKQKATNFSYRQAVEKTRLKRTQNCTEQMEDIFRRIFQPEPSKRLTFWQLINYPMFKKHFPEGNQTSKLIYNKNNKKMEQIQVQPQTSGPLAMKSMVMSRKHARSGQLKQEKMILGQQKDLIDILKDNVDLFLNATNIFEYHEVLMLVFNLLKYYIVLLRQFQKDITVDQLIKNYPGKQWSQFCKTYQYQELCQEVKQNISKNQIQFMMIYNECKPYLPAISKLNKQFQGSYYPTVDEKQLQGNFGASYRVSNQYFYLELIKKIKANKGEQSELFYLLTMIVISHAFESIIDDHEEMETVLQPYLKEKKITIKDIDYSQLRMWLSKVNAGVLKDISVALINHYFGKS